MLPRLSRLATIVLVAPLLIVAPLFYVHALVSAVDLGNRSVRIGTSQVSVATTNQFNMTLKTSGTLGSISFEYCVNSPLPNVPCVAPTGFSASGATLSNQTGETGFSIDGTSTANKLILSRAPAATLGTVVSYTFANITNPSTTGTVYVRLATYASNDASGAVTDNGAVAFATTRSVQVQTYVPPYLTFCAGVSVALDCSTTNGVLLDFGDLVPNQTRTVTSQYAGACNDPTGFVTSLVGTTMTSGNNIIPGLDVPQTSKVGASQFGLNLRSNSSPSVGAEPQGVGSSTPAAPFNAPNLFSFVNQPLSSSPISTDFNRFTVSYIVNVNKDQNPGIYTTTLTYVATAAF